MKKDAIRQIPQAAKKSPPQILEFKDQANEGTSPSKRRMNNLMKKAVKIKKKQEEQQEER